MSSVSKMESNLTSMWVSFFTAAGIPSDVGATYALTFTENSIQSDMLLDLNKEYLRDMGITRMGHVIAILRHAKQVHENTARDRVLNSTSNTTKVPVAAVTGRLTTTPAKSSSPATRMLEHYTRNTTPETSPNSGAGLKRKLTDLSVDTVVDIKKNRTIRFGAKVPIAPVEAPAAKQTVFARLGINDSIKPVPTSVKPVFSRLGAKNLETIEVPLEKDALKYEGILKSPPTKNTISVTASKNARKIAVGTMRADEAPLSVKEKLALPKTKSVKFSNKVEYKEIEKVSKPVNSMFNKPERRLSMPEEQSVKARLGTKASNLTITRSIFNRLGV